MNKDNDNRQVPQFDPRATRERLDEIRRERKQRSAEYHVSNSPTTIVTNMIIQMLSGIILGVGIYYIIQYLNLRRPYMQPQHYSIFVGTMLLVAAGWLVYTFIRLRADWLRYGRAKREQEERRQSR